MLTKFYPLPPIVHGLRIFLKRQRVINHVYHVLGTLYPFQQNETTVQFSIHIIFSERYYNSVIDKSFHVKGKG